MVTLYLTVNSDILAKKKKCDLWIVGFVTTKFKLPKWLYNKMQNRALNKHRNLSYVYDKDSSKVKPCCLFRF